MMINIIKEHLQKIDDFKAKTKEEDNEILDMSNPEDQDKIDALLGI